MMAQHIAFNKAIKTARQYKLNYFQGVMLQGNYAYKGYKGTGRYITGQTNEGRRIQG